MTNTEMLQRVNELALYLEKAETNLYHDCVANGFREIPEWPESWPISP